MSTVPGSTDAIADFPLRDLLTDCRDVPDDLMAGHSGTGHVSGKEILSLGMTPRTIFHPARMLGGLCRSGTRRKPPP